MVGAAGIGDTVQDLIALCRAGLASGYGPVGALFLAGLAGGLAHCAGMCGPFVLGQAALGAAQGVPGDSRTRRLLAAALLPYHLGRATTYAALGAVAAAGSGVVGRLTDPAWLAVPLLLAAAALLMARAGADASTPFGRALSGLTRPLASLAARARGRGGLGRFVVGLALGFLPCGLVYAALAGAAATADPVLGAAAMAAFAAGTAPALMVVGYAGHGLARRAGAPIRLVAVALLVANAGTVGAAAWLAAP